MTASVVPSPDITAAPDATPNRTPTPIPTPFPSTPTLWLLILTIIAIGAFLRFWRLDHQGLWLDEWATIHRITNSFDDMLYRLNGQGFPPGWYSLLWFYTHQIATWIDSPQAAFSTASLRLIPALLGTFTVAAMYLLARGFTDRRGALLVMLLAAVNPFLIYYARDIKMYGALYLFVTLTMGLFLRWQQTQRHWLWWPLYTLSSAAMVALHAAGWFLIPIQLVWLFTKPRVKSLDAPLWILTIVLMSLLPLWWYLNKTNWVDKVAGGDDGGIGWNSDYTDMNATTLLSLPADHLFGFLIPSYPPDPRVLQWFKLGRHYNEHLATRSYPWLASAEMWTLLFFASLCILGLFPWRGWKSPWQIPSLTRNRGWWLLLWIALPMTVLALTWLPDDSPWSTIIWRGHKPTEIWEPRYLGIICPAFIILFAGLLRRLPTRPLRLVAITAAVLACTLSSLSNHLIYRQFPWPPVVADILPYLIKDNPSALKLILPQTQNSYGADAATFLRALNVAPENWDDQATGNYFESRGKFWRDQTGRALTMLRSAANEDDTQAIALIDLDGDLPDGQLSDAKIAQRIPHFSLVSTHLYRWHLEWRYYIFNEVRVRIWKRTPAATAPARN